MHLSYALGFCPGSTAFLRLLSVSLSIETIRSAISVRSWLYMASLTSSTSSEGYGEYLNVYTGERQDSYKGSVEQQEDIATLDKMIEEGY